MQNRTNFATNFPKISTSAISRIREISSEFGDSHLSEDEETSLLRELYAHKKTLLSAFSQRQRFGDSLKLPESKAHFDEKLTGLVSFSRLALIRRERGNYQLDKILDNIDHYSYAVAKYLRAEWKSKSKRPASDLAIKKTTIVYDSELKRLADR
ncbi:MAG: hypothetical protein AAGJ34_12575 [Pseudomonadota bacterium]